MEETPMNEVLQKIIGICFSILLFISGCTSLKTSSEIANDNQSIEVIHAEDRIFFPRYGLSIIQPQGSWDKLQGLSQGELVLWVNKDDGSIIEIMASKSSRNLSYHNIAIEFTKATCDLIWQQTPTVNCEIVNETQVVINKIEFFKVNIVYQIKNVGLPENTIVYLYKAKDYVYHFIFMGENHSIFGPEMMNSIVFLEDDKKARSSISLDEQISLIDACYYGETEIVEDLLDKGANANSQNEDGVTALSYAADRGHEEIVKKLIIHGANVNARSDIGSTPLINASFMGHLRIVKLLIANGADVNIQSNEGTTALMNAAAHGYKEIVEVLLANGAELNTCEECGLTALWNAISGGYVDIVNILVEHGADINAKANDGTTALMNAVYTGNINIVKILIKAGVEVNAKAHNGSTALMIAKLKGYVEIIKLLKQAGAVDEKVPKQIFI